MESGRIRLLLREAINSAKAGNTSWARECLGRILRSDPRHEEAWLWMSAVLETTAEKRYCLDKVLTINPDNAQAKAGLRYLDQQAGIETGPEEPERTICPMCGEPNERAAFQCVNCGQDLFVLCPSCGERMDIDHTACAACGLETGDASTGAGYFFHLGELYLEHGQPKRALETWDKTLLLDPDYPRIAEVAAEAFMASGQRDLAIQSVERAIAEATGEAHRRELRLRLANYHRDLGRLEDAERLYRELLKEDQERHEPQADLYSELGSFYRQGKDLEAARHYYEMAVALDEELHQVHYSLAEILLQEGYEHRALSELRWLQEIGGEVGSKATAQIEALRPPVPEAFRNRWQETFRGMARFFLAGFLLLLLTTGLQWNSISPQNGVGLLLLFIGGYCLTAATATPNNLPTPTKLAKLAEGPTMMRLRARRGKGKKSARPGLLQRFLVWQTRSAQRLAAGLRVAQMRAIKQLHRLASSTSRTWERFKMSKVGRFLGALPQSRVGRFLAALGRTRFFQALGRFSRRIVPRRAGASLFKRLGQAIRGGGKRLVEQAGRVELTELQMVRWVAGVVGLILLALGISLILTT